MSIFDDKMKATAGLIPDEQIERLRITWKKGRNMFQSFYTEIDTVRRAINNDELFASWCFFQLHIDVQTQTDVAVALRKEDAARVRRELENSRRADKDRAEAEAHAKRLEKIKRENELSEERVKNAEFKARQAAAAKKVKLQIDRDKRKQQRAARAEKEGDDMMRARVAILADPMATRDEIMAIANVPRNVYDKARAALEAEGKIPSKEKIDEQALYERYVHEGLAAASNQGVYGRAVEECRRLVGYQWEIGEWAVRVGSEAKYGSGTLIRFAKDIDVEYSTLKTYVATVKAWPEKAERPAFSIALTLINHPDRVAIVKREPYMTVEEATEIMRKWRTESNVIPFKD